MTDGVRPVVGPQGASVQERREGDRRGQDRRRHSRGEAEASESRELVLVGPVSDPQPSAKPAAPIPVPPAAFTAQIIGQKGQKRGLRGGPPVLEAARTTYLETEYSGENDRRPVPGQETETEI